ncbi:MAG: hypothetical protein ACKOBU_06705, partial [Gammaproteobacteria bacterium]
RTKDQGIPLCAPFGGSLDYAFAVTLARRRRVPSSLYTFPFGLGSALSCALLRLEFADFDTIPCAVSPRTAQLLAMSPLH